MSAAKAPCLCCDGDRRIYMDLGGGDSEPWGCPVCKATGFGPSWFRTDRDEDSEYYRWDDGVEYEWANERWVRGEDEVIPAECMSCGRPLTERTGVPLCARCEGTMRVHAGLEQARIDEERDR